MIGRIVIEDIRPRTPGGHYPAKVVAGERVVVRAAIFKEGHDALAARVRLRRVAGPGPEGNGSAAARSAVGSPGKDKAGGAGSKASSRSGGRRAGATVAAAGRGSGAVAAAGTSAGARAVAGVATAAAGSPAAGGRAEASSTATGPAEVASESMVPLGNDEWAAVLRAPAPGRYELIIDAWTDRYATWAHKVRAKLAAGADVEVEMAEAVQLIQAKGTTEPALAAALAALGDGGSSAQDRLAPLLAQPAAAALAGPALAVDRTEAPPAGLWVDRERALVGAWYELFPRSVGGLRGAAGLVGSLAGMGFDVLYLPPIHPVGSSYRKGRNNTLVAGPDDPGSPWAIGSAEGGHCAIEPSLGSFEDFDVLVATLRDHGMELAMDYALQCSPDHPWVREHPAWFHHRPDGSIAYAENPPKKYQDIYPINFWPDTEADRVELWEACRSILRFWIDRGVRIFRVDNPHTKPFALWEWVIASVQRDHPDVVFLAEAFTRPRVMAKLAEVGFSQSYTYFTWRTGQYGPEGLREYLEELAHSPKTDFMRPNFWPNTPDILSGPLRNGPPAAFALRLVLAATLSPSYGVYSGYELYENEPASEANEEYLNSEKYEIKHRDFDRPDSLRPLMTALNRIRRRHAAFGRLRSLRFHASVNPSIIVYSKISDDRGDVVLVAVSLDPFDAQETTVHLDLPALGLAPGQAFEVYDELSGETYRWWGPDVFIRLEPWRRVAHIFAVPMARPRPDPLP